MDNCTKHNLPFDEMGYCQVNPLTGDLSCSGWQQMQERIAELESALAEYGRHKQDCASLKNIGSRHYPKYVDCDCGLEQALKNTEGV